MGQTTLGKTRTQPQPVPPAPRAVTPRFTRVFQAVGLEDALHAQSPFQGLIHDLGGFCNPVPTPPLTPQGHPPLVKVLAQFFGKLLGRDLDPMTNVMVTVGAYQALFCCFQAFVDEGDEVTQDLGLLHRQPSPRRALLGCGSASSCRLAFIVLFQSREGFNPILQYLSIQRKKYLLQGIVSFLHEAK